MADLPHRWPELGVDDLLCLVTAGSKFEVLDVLFRKVTDEDVVAWRERFGAEQG